MAGRSKNILQEFQPGERREEPLSALFHENSKLTPERKLELGMRIAQVQNNPDLLRRMTCSYKSYPHQPQIALPVARLGTVPPLDEIILGRRSARQFETTKSVTLGELSNLLQLSYGITGSLELGSGIIQYLRATPSAGGLYPLEIYVLAQRVEGLDPGLYHYRVAHHALEQIEPGDQGARLRQSESDWGMISTAAVDLFIGAVFDRVLFKYRERGYRFLLTEAGMLAQSLTLLGECQGVRSCIMSGWLDDEVNDMLHLDGRSEGVLLALCLGK
jgi:SagB-type dehydrogenase family enzyme